MNQWFVKFRLALAFWQLKRHLLCIIRANPEQGRQLLYHAIEHISSQIDDPELRETQLTKLHWIASGEQTKQREDRKE
jgi:hypothetical protein